MVTIASIVEGDGEVEALPVLIRRIASVVTPEDPPRVERPIRVPRGRLLKAEELERAVKLAARRAGPGGRILVVFDADDDCPRELGTKVLGRATSARTDRHIRVVLAKREYEAWFLAAAESIAGRRELSADLVAPEVPEAIRDAKGWLSARMPRGRAYRETRDQAALSATFDLKQARRSAPSFAKLWRDVEALLA